MARPSGSRAAFRRGCCPIAPSSWPAGWRRSSGAAGGHAGAARRRRGRARPADRRAQRRAGRVVAALRGDVRLRRPARRPVRLAGAAAAQLPARPDGRPDLRHRGRAGRGLGRRSAALRGRDRRACCAPAGTRCWSWATAWWTAAPSTRRTPSPTAGAPVGLEPVARASQARPIHDRRLAQIFSAQPRREHLLLLRRRR